MYPYYHLRNTTHGRPDHPPYPQFPLGFFWSGHYSILNDFLLLVELRDRMIEEHSHRKTFLLKADLVDMKSRVKEVEESLKKVTDNQVTMKEDLDKVLMVNKTLEENLKKVKNDEVKMKADLDKALVEKEKLIIRQFASAFENKFSVVILGSEYEDWTMRKLALYYLRGLDSTNGGRREGERGWDGMYVADRTKLDTKFKEYFGCSDAEIPKLWNKIEDIVTMLKKGGIPVAHPNHIKEGYSDEDLKALMEPMFMEKNMKSDFIQLFNVACMLDAEVGGIGLTKHIEGGRRRS